MFKTLLQLIENFDGVLKLDFLPVGFKKNPNFLIDFLDELGNFKQKRIYISNCNFFFYILQQQTLCI